MLAQLPASASLTLYAGDTADITFRLTSMAGGVASPLTVSPGEVFALFLRSGTLNIIARTDDPSQYGLSATTAESSLVLHRQVSAREAALIAQGGAFSLVRYPSTGVKRTYIAGSVIVAAGSQVGSYGSVIDLAVDDGDTIIEFSVTDTASYTDAREAVIRQDVAAAIAASRTAIVGGADESHDTLGKLAALFGGAGTILYLPDNPALADIPDGSIRVVKNQATGRLTLWANDGGMLVDLLTFTPAV